MKPEEKELIEEKFKGVYVHQQANFDIMSEKLEQIYKQTLLTNGRVNILESQTRIVRFFEKKPIFLLLVMLGLVFLVSIMDIKDIIKLF